MLAVEPHDAGVNVERLDGDERGIVGQAAPPDAEVRAFDLQPRKGAEVQVAEFHITVEPGGQIADDSVAERIGLAEGFQLQQ